MIPKQFKFNEDRLVKYARYLQCGNLKCEKLFSSISKDKSKDNSIGRENLRPLFFLPIMEIPMIFPKEWVYDENYIPIWKEDEDRDVISSCVNFFGLNRYLFYHIWSPGAQRPEIYGGKNLGPKPTIRQIANNILDLVEVVKFYEGVKENNAFILSN